MWGLNFHLLKAMLTSVHFIEAGFWRYVFGVAALAIYVWKSFPTWSLFKRHAAGILLVGLFGLFGFNLFLFWGLRYTSSINASLIISLSPIVTLYLGTLFLKSAITYTQVIGSILGLIGVGYLMTKGDVANLNLLVFSKGDVLILLAMLLSSFYHIWVKKYAVSISNAHFTFLTQLVCLLSFILIIPFFIEPHSINYGIRFWMVSILFGVVGTAVTYILWNKGLGFIGASKAGMFMNIIPLSTAVITVILGNELTTVHMGSGILIFSGLIVSQIKQKNEFSNAQK